VGIATATFQYPNGSPVASGQYQWKLSSDAIEFSSTSACIVPPVIYGNLDVNGNMTSTFAFNDVLSTTAGLSTTYQLTVKSNAGNQVWNENYYLTGTAANLNIIPPGGSGGPPITVTATTTIVQGQNLAPGAVMFGGNSGWQNLTLYCVMPGASIMFPGATSFQVVLAACTNNATTATGPVTFGQITMLKTLANNASVISATPVTIGGTATPTITVAAASTEQQPFLFTTDAINVTVDNQHDYWLAMFFTSASANLNFKASTCPNSPFPCFDNGQGNGNNIPTASALVPMSGNSFSGTGYVGYFVTQMIAY
jgi:hypothetical protein